MKVSFAADLHLFARRSQGERHFERLVEAAHCSDAFVLGGDIFDFRWSTYASDLETAEAALQWLERFDEATRNCQVHFLMGNHDDHPILRERLPRLLENSETFAWSRYFHRIGDTLFLHGDVADRTMTAACLQRQRECFEHGSRTPLQHRLYDIAIKANLHRMAPPAVYPKKRVAQRLLSYMQHIGQGTDSGVAHVFFGHTHRPLDHYHFQGVHFHNGGAPIGNAPFRILQRDVILLD